MWCCVCLILLCFIVLFSEVDACFCPHIWEPVCASDEQLYSNMCFFMCARVKQPKLMPRPLISCHTPTNHNNNNENEGTSVVDLFPVNNPYAQDPTFNTNGHGNFLPVCSWTCRNVPTHPHFKICDELASVYSSDCEFYKAVCKAELRGFLLRRSPCKKSAGIPSKRRKTWL